MCADGFHPSLPVLRTIAQDGVGMVTDSRWERMLAERGLLPGGIKVRSGSDDDVLQCDDI